MKVKLFLLGLMVVVISNAQTIPDRKCASYNNLETYLSNTENARRYHEIERFTENWTETNRNSLRSSNEIITIPVVIHVVYNGSAQNISNEQIQSQLEVLNKDFRKANADFAGTPQAFKDVSADAQIEFCLASVDPEGNPTTGINRKSTSIANIGAITNQNNADSRIKHTSQGGQDPWDPSRYLNIWIGGLGSGLLGYATFPGGGAAYDGVVIAPIYFGTIGTVSAPFNLGRTATHEVGHYLNLFHIWGDGDCFKDDQVTDTPTQGAPTQNGGCPTFPVTSGNTYCSSAGVNGSMFVNYMDYSDDACMTMFTEGQKTRMLAALNGPRAGLKTSDVCNALNVNKFGLNTLKLYPNPTNSILNIGFADAVNNDGIVNVLDISGRLVKKQVIKSGIEKLALDMSHLKSGLYMVKVAVNGNEIIKRVVVN